MNSRLLLVAWIVVLPAGGCVGSELEPPANHPGHAAARSGTLMLSRALRPEHDVQEDTTDHERPPHAGHAGHETHITSSGPNTESIESPSSPASEEASGATYVCPMHPEIIREEAGKCPICGMKLVPKEAEK